METLDSTPNTENGENNLLIELAENQKKATVGNPKIFTLKNVCLFLIGIMSLGGCIALWVIIPVIMGAGLVKQNNTLQSNSTSTQFPNENHIQQPLQSKSSRNRNKEDNFDSEVSKNLSNAKFNPCEERTMDCGITHF